MKPLNSPGQGFTSSKDTLKSHIHSTMVCPTRSENLSIVTRKKCFPFTNESVWEDFLKVLAIAETPSLHENYY